MKIPPSNSGVAERLQGVSGPSAVWSRTLARHLLIYGWAAVLSLVAVRAADPAPAPAAAPAEARPKRETLLSVGIVQIALMTLSAHVGAYGNVEPASGAGNEAKPGELIVIAAVPSDDAAVLKLDRPVEISTNLANSKVIGKLLAIGPRVDERTGSVAVRASVPAGSGFLPGQFVKLSIATDEHPNVVSVPVESLVKDPDVGYVISIVNGDIQTQKPVRVGIRDGDFVEVEGEGVKVGMTVVSSGAYALPRQSKVRVITPLD